MSSSDPAADAPRPGLPAVKARIAAYVEALLEIGAHVNLTAAASPGAARDILVEPSLAIALAWNEAEPPRVAVDIGSGNGFPGVAVAALWPACRVVLVERRQKKARAIQACLDAAGITNAAAVGCDARELKHDHADLLGATDLVTLRAVTSLEDGNRLAAPLLAPGGRVVHWKRPGLIEREGDAGDRSAHTLGLTRAPDVAHGVDGVLVTYTRARGGRRG